MDDDSVAARCRGADIVYFHCYLRACDSLQAGFTLSNAMGDVYLAGADCRVCVVPDVWGESDQDPCTGLEGKIGMVSPGAANNLLCAGARR